MSPPGGRFEGRHMREFCLGIRGQRMGWYYVLAKVKKLRVRPLIVSLPPYESSRWKTWGSYTREFYTSIPGRRVRQ